MIACADIYITFKDVPVGTLVPVLAWVPDGPDQQERMRNMLKFAAMIYSTGGKQ